MIWKVDNSLNSFIFNHLPVVHPPIGRRIQLLKDNIWDVKFNQAAKQHGTGLAPSRWIRNTFPSQWMEPVLFRQKFFVVATNKRTCSVWCTPLGSGFQFLAGSLLHGPIKLDWILTQACANSRSLFQLRWSTRYKDLYFCFLWLQMPKHDVRMIVRHLSKSIFRNDFCQKTIGQNRSFPENHFQN